MKRKRHQKLTPAEAKSLEHFIDERGGQTKASVLLSVSTTTLSRTVNRRTAPSPMLHDKLVGAGVVKQTA